MRKCLEIIHPLKIPGGIKVWNRYVCASKVAAKA
jgi:hypothetical protein